METEGGFYSNTRSPRASVPSSGGQEDPSRERELEEAKKYWKQEVGKETWKLEATFSIPYLYSQNAAILSPEVGNRK